MTPYKDPPGTLRQAIENAIDGGTFLSTFDYESKHLFIDLILVHVEDYIAREFSSVAYDTDQVKSAINTFRKRVLGDYQGLENKFPEF